MEIKYKLDIENYLEHQLYNLSTSSVFKKQINKIRFSGSIYYGLAALLILVTFSNGWSALDILFVSICLVMAIFNFFNSPTKNKIATKKLNLDINDEIYDSTFFSYASFSFDESFIYIQDSETETRITIDEIKTLTELNKTIVLRMNSGKTILISKSNISNLDQLRQVLENITTKHNIPFIIQDKWKWL